MSSQEERNLVSLLTTPQNLLMMQDPRHHRIVQSVNPEFCSGTCQKEERYKKMTLCIFYLTGMKHFLCQALCQIGSGDTNISKKSPFLVASILQASLGNAQTRQKKKISTNTCKVTYKSIRKNITERHGTHKDSGPAPNTDQGRPASQSSKTTLLEAEIFLI